jgi:hypothetical protein
MILAGLSVVQAHRDGVFAVFVKVKRDSPSVMKLRQRKARTSNPVQPDMAHIASEEPLKKPDRIQNFSHYVSRSHTSLHGYYAKI